MSSEGFSGEMAWTEPQLVRGSEPGGPLEEEPLGREEMGVHPVKDTRQPQHGLARHRPSTS